MSSAAMNGLLHFEKSYKPCSYLFLRACSTVSNKEKVGEIPSSSKSTPFSYFTPPERFELDDIILKPDHTWNISQGITRLLGRRLLNEKSNPLNLLKQRIVNYFNTSHRRPASGSPTFVMCDKLPRVVSIFDNFDSLMTPMDHVSRRPSDTYYINSNYCLRSHTTAHQNKLLRQGVDNFIMFGDVYRRDEIDRTHYPCFHQLDCVRTYSALELFGSFQHERDEPPLFESTPHEDLRTPEKQAHHSFDTARVLVIKLKSCLEGLSRAIFGPDVQIRWVDAYFPFTHPSFEMEVFYDNRWLEVLGCGVMDQKLLETAGAGSKVGWAFGLGLERLAMKLYEIPDIRLFWCEDSGFLSQFANLDPDDVTKYRPFSAHPQVINDLSFWIPSTQMSSGDMKSNAMDVIRTIGGNLVEQVELFDEFTNPKTGKLSHSYRVVYRSMDKGLTKNEANIIHKAIEENLSNRFGVEIR